MKRVIVDIDNTKLSKQLLSLIPVGRYQDTHIEVTVHDDGISACTVCVNQYGTRWNNHNDVFVPICEIPFYTLKKFYYFCSDD